MRLFEQPFKPRQETNTLQAESNNEQEQPKHTFNATLQRFFAPDRLRQIGIKTSAEDLKKLQENLRLLRDIVGIETISELGEKEAQDVEKQEEHIAILLAQGAQDRLFFDGGLTGGYYGGAATNEEGEYFFDTKKVDVNRWARKAKWDKAGLTMPDETIPSEDIARLLEGYLTAELTSGQFSSLDFNGQGAFTTFKILSEIQDEGLSALALKHAPLLQKVRSELNDEKAIAQFDQGAHNLGLDWDEETKSYEAIIEEQTSLSEA